MRSHCTGLNRPSSWWARRVCLLCGSRRLFFTKMLCRHTPKSSDNMLLRENDIGAVAAIWSAHYFSTQFHIEACVGLRRSEFCSQRHYWYGRQIDCGINVHSPEKGDSWERILFHFFFQQGRHMARPLLWQRLVSAGCRKYVIFFLVISCIDACFPISI